MDNIVGYYGSSSPEGSQENENRAGPPPVENSDEHSSGKSSSAASSSSRDKSSSPDHCSDPPYQHGHQRRSSYRERSKSHSPPRFERRPSDRMNRYRRSRSRSQERRQRSRSPPDRRRRSRSRSPERRQRSRSRSQERRRRSRSRSQERYRRSRSRSPELRSRYGRRSPPRQYGRNHRPSPPHRRNRRSRSPGKRRYPSTPVVIPNRNKQPDCSTTGDSGDTSSNVPGATPEQRLENALSAMQQHRAVRPGGMSEQQFQAVQEKRKQLWKKKTPTTATQWDAYAATFGQSGGGSTPGDNSEDPQSKFRRLMGMKGDSKPLNQDTMQKSSEIISQQNKLLADLDQQYEESRFLTHRARGVGFGFGGSIVSNLTKTEGVVSEKGPEDK